MTDREWKVRRDQLERYRVLEEETTDPLAAGLLHDIVLELEAELKMAATPRTVTHTSLPSGVQKASCGARPT